MVFRRRCFFLFLFIKHSFFFVSSQYFSMIFGATLSSISWEGDFFLFVFRVYFFDHQKMRFQGNSIKATLMISSYFLVKTKGPKKIQRKKRFKSMMIFYQNKDFSVNFRYAESELFFWKSGFYLVVVVVEELFCLKVFCL